MSNTPSTPPYCPETIVRRAVSDDAPAIENLYRELVDDPHIRVLPEQVATLSPSQTSHLLFDVSGGVLCGTVLLTLCPDAMYRTQPFGIVENIIVAQANRGRGIGRQLLAEVERLAREHHYTKLMLLSASLREAANAFFRRCGFNSQTKQYFVNYRSQCAP